MKKKALIVAVTDAPNMSGGLLSGAAWNAGALVGFISLRGFEIRVLTGSEATRAAILDGAANWLAADYQAGDVLIFAVSAHGEVVQGTGENFFYPADFDTVDSTGRRTPVISDSDLRTAFSSLVSGTRLYCLFDCCRTLPMEKFSFRHRFGLFLRKLFAFTTNFFTATVPGRLENRVEGMNRVELRGCQSDQSCHYNGSPLSGLFTRAFVAVANSSPSTLEAMQATFREMRSNAADQLPEAKGPSELLDQRLFS